MEIEHSTSSMERVSEYKKNQWPRMLRVFAYDPSTANRFENRRVRNVTITLPSSFDNLNRKGTSGIGPSGEYIEVIDYDPSNNVFYTPVNLNSYDVLINNGLEPSEENPQFHQQMVYAVAMFTVQNFERALGRVALWSPRNSQSGGMKKLSWKEREPEYVRQLRIYPHAMREANAYYDSNKKALLFGYFDAPKGSRVAEGTTVFTCLSQDIIAHETSHALLDGLHPRFIEPSNPDVLALHEAFADIVAILQHFSFYESLKDQLAITRGDLDQNNLLNALAVEFGEALHRGGALRNGLGHFEADEWVSRLPDPTSLGGKQSVHERGSILVAAVFLAFRKIYKDRTADLINIASNGSGILPEGQLNPSLVHRLALEAAKSARHVLQMCIRALDYCPPVDVRFGDFLRAVMTADHDLFPEDQYGYRAAFLDSFKEWGIVPEEFPIMSERMMLWPTLEDVARENNTSISNSNIFQSKLSEIFSKPDRGIRMFRSLFDQKENIVTDAEGGNEYIDLLEWDVDRITELLNEQQQQKMKASPQIEDNERFTSKDVLRRNLLSDGLGANREIEFLARRFYARLFWGLIMFILHIEMKENKEFHELLKGLGLNLDRDLKKSVEYNLLTRDRPGFFVESVRMATRTGDRGQVEQEYIVEITQTRRGYFDRKVQEKAESNQIVPKPDYKYRSGCTWLINADTFEIRRVIRSRHRIDDDKAFEKTRQYFKALSSEGNNAFYSSDRNIRNGVSFAHLHRDAGSY